MTSDEKRAPEFDKGSGGAAGAATSADTAYTRVSDEEAAPTSPSNDNDSVGAPNGNAEASPRVASDPGAGGEQQAAAASAEERPGSAEDELAGRAARAEEYLALAQRTKADFENYRRRAARDAAAAQERGAVRLALELLPAIDNLERALAHAEVEAANGTGDGDDEHSLLAGIRHVHSDVVAALGRAGIERYSPEGEQFDPQYHEAVAQQPVEGADPGTVVEVFQRGYRTGSSVVRPARVVVAG